MGFPYLRSLHEKVYAEYYELPKDALEDPSMRPELSRQYRAKAANIVVNTDHFMEKANIDHVITNYLRPQALSTHPRVSFIPVVDPLLYPFGEGGLKVTPQGRQHLRCFLHLLSVLKQRYGLKENPSCGEYLAFCDQVMSEYQRAGCPGFKIASAYVRSMDFGPRSECGEKLYQQAASGDAESIVQFQNFMAWHVITWAAEHSMPVQFHTALVDGYLSHADPQNLQIFLQDPKTDQAKIVLLHAGYPFFQNAKALAMASKPMVPNQIYIDISGRVMFANHPAIIARMLREFLEVPQLWNKILYGSDTMAGERFLSTCARTGRDAVFIALSGMISDEIIDENTAKVIAAGILRNNAVRLYHLPINPV